MTPVLLCPVATQVSRRAIMLAFCEKRGGNGGKCFKATATGYSSDFSPPHSRPTSSAISAPVLSAQRIH